MEYRRQLPFRGLVEEIKVTRTKEAILYWDENEPKVLVRIEWKASHELSTAEQMLTQKVLEGTVGMLVCKLCTLNDVSLMRTF